MKALKNIRLIFIFIVFALDVLALAGGVFYLARPTRYMLWNLYGCVVLLALSGSIISACTGDKRRFLDYCYLLMNFIGIPLIMVMNTVASSGVQNKTSQSLFALIFYNAIFLTGAVTAGAKALNGVKKSGAENKPAERQGKPGNIMRWLAVVLLCVCLAGGVFICYILLGKSTGNMIEVFIPEYALFWGLHALGASALAVRLRHRNKGSVFNKIMMALGAVIFIICLIPLASVPFTVKNADAAYREAFGNSYIDDISADDYFGFSRTPFSMQNYFFGARTSDYDIYENVLYYEGTAGKDAGIRLHFDAYTPSGGDSADKFPVLIRIHGGSWSMGDKGASNYAEINKHFVNQGYAVFDIQYGLYYKGSLMGGLGAPDSIKGDFDVDDMVRHIGIFYSYLADHAAEYGADTDRAFISGGSAGGQLAVASALGITSGRYTDMLDPRLNIKGLIPYYPADSLPPAVGIGGSADLVDPVALVDENSPPCLIYHGTHDGIVDPIYASILKETYDKNGGSPCALLWMDFASHGSDFYTPGYYNQIFTYYMERFMLQYK